MDQLAHILAGVAASHALGFTRRYGWSAPLLLAVATNLPDLDGVVGVCGRDAYMWEHRGFTHSLLGVATIPIAFAAIARAFLRRMPFEVLYLVGFVGFALHALMDAATSWGTMLLYPFDRTRFAVDWVYIMDGIYWLALAVPLAAGRWGFLGREAAGRVALASVGTYVLACGLLHGQALRALEAEARARGIEVTAPACQQAFPQPFGPLRFGGVVRDGDSVHWTLVALPPKQPGTATWITYADAARLPVVRRALAEYAPARRYFEWWARVPVATVEEGAGSGRRIRLADLRFRSWSFDAAPFQLVVDLDDSGRPVGHCGEGAGF